jgi:hypothetical protein
MSHAQLPYRADVTATASALDGPRLSRGAIQTRKILSVDTTDSFSRPYGLAEVDLSQVIL